MKWKEKGINKYPDIILSDCMITNIQGKEGEITVKFSEYGFFKKDSQSNKYFRTDTAQIVINECDVDNIFIKEIRNQKLSEELYFESMYDIEPSIFMENISTGKWKFEIVEEFYSTGGALYIGKIRADENSFWCHVKLRFKNLVYFWNEVRYDRPF